MVQFRTPSGSVSPAYYPTNYYLGGSTQGYIDELVDDYFDQSSYRLLGYDSLLAINSGFNEAAHGYVVDIRVDGISTHFMDNPYNTPTGTGILGNDTYKFTVQFNRAMDVEVLHC